MNEITNHEIKCSIALASLRQVIDPEIGLNIVDLGLIYQVDFDELNDEIYLTMTLTTQFCPMGESIRDGAMNAMQNSFPNYTININIVFDPQWSHEKISEEGKEFLNQ